jgi:hypothetical protein
MIKHVIAAAMLASLAFITPAQAEDSAKIYLEKIDQSDPQESSRHRSVLAAFGIGLFWANIHLVATGGKPIYCQPENLVLTDYQEVDMVRRYIKEFPDAANAPAGLVVLKALQNVFPCKQTAQ